MKFSISGLLMLSAASGFVAAATIPALKSSNDYINSKEIRPFGPTLSAQTKTFNYDIKNFKLGDSHLAYLHAIDITRAKEIALKHIKQTLDINSENYIVKNAYTSSHNQVSHIYLRQVVGGLEVLNGDLNINIDKYGDVMSMSSSFYTKPKTNPINAIVGIKSQQEELIEDWIAKNTEKLDLSLDLDHDLRQLKLKAKSLLMDYTSSKFITVNKAIKHLSKFLGQEIDAETSNGLSASEFVDANGDTFAAIKGLPTTFAEDGQVIYKPAFLQLDNGNLAAVWDLEVKQKDDWWNSFVSAENGEVVSLINWSNNASYRVYPFGTNDPSEGDREMLVDPHNKLASPNGWHAAVKGRESQDTSGNNVYAQENLDGGNQWKYNKRPIAEDRNFDFELDLTRDPDTYLDAAVTNLFYINNMMHDVFYQYGFDEKSGNFQENNFERGGRGKDAVIANAQDGSGTNNANFATPPDGRQPRMRMYVWDVTSPRRDGDLDAGIIIHEYSHGISIRLTGGPANVGCLSWGESGGMGEGWGDFFATLIRLKPHHNNTSSFLMGDYSANRGIRHYPYSTDMNINPATYKFLDKGDYWGVHPKGSVWAEILYEMLWNLIDKHGFTTDLVGRNLKYGNVLALQLVVDGLKLQPCRPGFIEARDAILLAEKALTGGENQCELWKAFAKRGLGVGAKLVGETPWGGGIRTESYDTIKECS